MHEKKQRTTYELHGAETQMFHQPLATLQVAQVFMAGPQELFLLHGIIFRVVRTEVQHVKVFASKHTLDSLVTLQVNRRKQAWHRIHDVSHGCFLGRLLPQGSFLCLVSFEWLLCTSNIALAT